VHEEEAAGLTMEELLTLGE